MHLSCPTCGTTIPYENAGAQHRVAKCVACNRIFETPEPQKITTGDRQTIPLPKGITMERKEGLVFSRRWHFPALIFITIWVILWLGFLFSYYFMALIGEASSESLLVTVPHLIVGLCVGYLVLAGYLNRTWITLHQGMLTITPKPLPWWRGNHQLESHQITRLYCKQHIQRNKGGKTLTYRLLVTLKNGKTLTLIYGAREYAQVQFLEQELEKELGLSHQHVDGEYQPT